jgi:hypothetical protein
MPAPSHLLRVGRIHRATGEYVRTRPEDMISVAAQQQHFQSVLRMIAQYDRGRRCANWYRILCRCAL